MAPIFFDKPSEFRKWLQKNHKKEKELCVGFYKVGSTKPSITWPQAVDEALCFGWIDGIRKSIDKDSYSNRFTPRKVTSNWSAINIKKVNELVEKGLMQPAGIEVFNNRNKERTNLYSFESETKKLPVAFERQFRKNKTAWKFFTSQSPSYKKIINHWVLSAKRETTQQNRLDKVIAESQEKRKIL